MSVCKEASCERQFSLAKDDMGDKRTSMLPDLLETLLFLHSKEKC
jgi:hypothetical protein